MGNLQWTRELCLHDSDGDGLTNGQELGDPCCLWNTSNDNPVGFRTSFLSHPGDPSDRALEQKVACPLVSVDVDGMPTAPQSSESATLTKPTPNADSMESYDNKTQASELPEPDQSTYEQNSTEPEESATVAADADDSSESDGSACFPGSATVKLDTGDVIRVDGLQNGHRVLVGPAEYSDVFMFSHASRNISSQFVRLHTASRSAEPLITSEGHYVHVVGKGLVAASAVRLGDRLLKVESGAKALVEDPVVSISKVCLQGLFNPHTVSGDIVIDGYMCSTYTVGVRPAFARTLLAPLRILYTTFGMSLEIVEGFSPHVHTFFAKMMPHGYLEEASV